DAGGAPGLRPQGQDVADGARGPFPAGVDDEHLARPDLLDRLLLGVHPTAIPREEVLAQRQVAQPPGEPRPPPAPPRPAQPWPGLVERSPSMVSPFSPRLRS